MDNFNWRVEVDFDLEPIPELFKLDPDTRFGGFPNEKSDQRVI